jgi:hypothetical protein
MQELKRNKRKKIILNLYFKKAYDEVCPGTMIFFMEVMERKKIPLQNGGSGFRMW